MCALRDFHSVKPNNLAQEYRLNIPKRKKKTVLVEKKINASEIPQIKIEVADTNRNVHFSSALWQEASDDEFNFFEDEEDFCSKFLSPTSPEQAQRKYILRIYETACKKYRLLPLSCIKTGLLKKKLSCKFLQLQKDDCKCICYALCNDRFVEHVDFQQNGMGPEPAHYFAEVIENSPFLTHIRMAENDLRSEGAMILCKAARDNKNIVSLDLSGNGLVESDGEIFEKLITESKYLTELYLANNELMDQGVRRISQALKGSETLQVLALSWNHIRLNGAVAIGEALGNNDSLQKVNLAWNGLHKDGAESIANALRKNDTLTELDLTCNRLSEYCIAEILKGLDDNSTLETLRIGQNHVTTRGAFSILQHIKENKASALNLLDLGNQEVHDKFEEVYREIEKERDLKVVYGAVWSTDRASLSRSAANDDEVALLSCNPLTVLMECMRLQNMRLLDFFKSLDTNKSNMICINELCDGMLKIGVPVHRQTLLRLLHKLDVDNNQQLDYGEMVEAQHMHRQNLRRIFAASSDVEFTKTEIGKVSSILRRIMSKGLIMKKSDCDPRKSPGRKSRTPSPFELEDVETGISAEGIKKDYLTATRNPSKTSNGRRGNVSGMASNRKQRGSHGSSASSRESSTSRASSASSSVSSASSNAGAD